jgi:hypothetical protein
LFWLGDTINTHSGKTSMIYDEEEDGEFVKKEKINAGDNNGGIFDAKGREY